METWYLTGNAFKLLNLIASHSFNTLFSLDHNYIYIKVNE